MSAREYWDEVEEIFAAVLAAAPAARPALLDARCGSRAGLRADVEALLAADARAAGFMVPHTFTPDALVSDDGGRGSFAGSRVGAFQMVERFARGGMGDVYRAERVEGGFTQQVAVKVIAGRFHGAEALRRFRAERQILAALQHPHIVSLLDGGVTPDGQPYIAMEYVEGLPIADFCRERALPLDERLRLFQQVCSAVAFAHQHLVVHRDLKPANVLVTREGDVKVLDFGVAKLLDPGIAPAPATMAMLGPLTPDYASPEQIRGLPVTTACDVYALGVMLYELVAGVRPYETSGRTLEEVVSLVAARDPARPSAAAAPGLPYPARQLRGDLDAIVLRALAKDPAARYASAGDLRNEIDRLLTGRPVEAREPSIVYTLRKAVARHRTAFAVAAISAVLLAAAVFGALWQARVAAHERERAVQRFNDVRELAGALIFRIHDEIAPLAGSTPARQVVIDEGLRFLERLEQDAAGDPDFLTELAEAYIRLGNVQGRPSWANLGDVEGARRSYRKAVALARAAGRTPAGLTALANAHLALTGVLEAAEGRAEAEAALAIASAWRGREPDSIPAIELLARATFFVALRTEHTDALPHWEEADRLYQALLARDPGGRDRLRNAALTQKYLGGHFEGIPDWDKAVEHHQEAYALDRRRLDADPDDLQAQLDLAIDKANLGYASWQRGDRGAAIDWYVRSLAIRQRLSDADPKDVYKRGRLGHVHVQLGQLYYETADDGRARSHVEQAIQIMEPLAANERALLVDLGVAQAIAGALSHAAGNPAAACPASTAAVTAFARADEGRLDERHRKLWAMAEEHARACGASVP